MQRTSPTACTFAHLHCTAAYLLPAYSQTTGGCFGAVIVKDGKIVGEGYNNVISRNDPTW
jgi:tRNA(Arg) A34 adenosine deaminase TadA